MSFFKFVKYMKAKHFALVINKIIILSLKNTLLERRCINRSNLSFYLWKELLLY